MQPLRYRKVVQVFHAQFYDNSHLKKTRTVWAIIGNTYSSLVALDACICLALKGVAVHIHLATDSKVVQYNAAVSKEFGNVAFSVSGFCGCTLA